MFLKAEEAKKTKARRFSHRFLQAHTNADYIPAVLANNTTHKHTKRSPQEIFKRHKPTRTTSQAVLANSIPCVLIEQAYQVQSKKISEADIQSKNDLDRTRFRHGKQTRFLVQNIPQAVSKAVVNTF